MNYIDVLKHFLSILQGCFGILMGWFGILKEWFGDLKGWYSVFHNWFGDFALWNVLWRYTVVLWCFNHMKFNNFGNRPTTTKMSRKEYWNGRKTKEIWRTNLLSLGSNWMAMVKNRWILWNNIFITRFSNILRAYEAKLRVGEVKYKSCWLSITATIVVH